MIAFERDTSDPAFERIRGDAPLVVSMPHVGIGLPADIAGRLTPQAATLADTDWHLPLVYDFLAALGATVIVATQSRYVIDLNRPPDGSSLYPGMATTGLVPTETFRGEPVWRDAPPTDTQIAERRERWWRPYHDALSEELARLRTRHPRVVLWDAHSIASVLPRFFEGRLPDLNFGTASGASCDLELIHAVLDPVRAQQHYSWVLDGRYKGGHITRHHGRPQDGVHAIQLEMAQAIYMDESAPFALDPALSARLRPLLRACLHRALDWALKG
ncbi:MAG: N-formylglutamate deformylase [Burkholderiales bacterium]|nr:MAG: N-formylglutamate deformylase [Burkholderiales bacterium]